MNRAGLLVLSGLLGGAMGLAGQQTTRRQMAASDDAAGQGKSIFVARCAKCHDDDALKKLPDGTTLLGRLAQSKDPEARLGTRIKNEQERHQVFLYLQSLLKNGRPTDPAK